MVSRDSARAELVRQCEMITVRGAQRSFSDAYYDWRRTDAQSELHHLRSELCAIALTGGYCGDGATAHERILAARAAVAALDECW